MRDSNICAQSLLMQREMACGTVIAFGMLVTLLQGIELYLAFELVKQCSTKTTCLGLFLLLVNYRMAAHITFFSLSLLQFGLRSIATTPQIVEDDLLKSIPRVTAVRQA